MIKDIAIGVDIGGSHITCIAVNLVSGQLMKETLSDRAVDNHDQAFRIIAEWGACLLNVFERVPTERIKGIGIAMPGPFDYVNGVALFKGGPKYENLYGFNIGDALRSTLDASAEMQVRFINDASAFAVGEAWTGKLAGANRSMAITLGTGFGSAFMDYYTPIVNGNEVPDLGCLYHLPFRGFTADEYFSTRWFLSNYTYRTGKKLSGVKELSELAQTDQTAKNLFVEFGNNLGEFLAPWLISFKAEILVVGGNISNGWSLFGDSFAKSLKMRNCNTRLEISELKEDAALLGSAYLLDDKFWSAIQPALPYM